MAAGNTQQQEDIRCMKRSMTLDLEAGGARAKRMRGQFSNSPVLTSPDLSRFALASPEVEQFIKGNIQTTTSSSTQPTPINVYLYPTKEITDSQAQFAKGFEEALAKVQENEQRAAKAEPTVVSLSSTATTGTAASVAVTTGATTTSTTAAASTAAPAAADKLTTYTNLTAANLHSLNVQMGTVSNCDPNGSSDGIGSDTSDSMTLKDEQTSLSAGSLGRINMGDQEKMKLERKRLRNRIAASKCRKKKLERITQLEDQVNRLKNDNQEYEKMISLLRNEVSSLRQEALIHRQHGCLIDL
ncbi:transcription factor AP-1-like [Galendromus occidentalis]|uniref:Transcription factor AP-1-like n=1 Tax=Galendromus occidentalis TaxID=34638 RepID=A0AAJ6QLT8_9ACAR|nr:transcription factor AP-1-like [Galendromus occidentalis]